MSQRKVYLGDGAYAEHDGYQFVISTERANGPHYVGLDDTCMDVPLPIRRVRLRRHDHGDTQTGAEK